MKRLTFPILLAAALLLLSSIPVFAGTGVLTGTLTNAYVLTGGSPDDDNTLCATVDHNTFYYTLRQIQVSVSGTYIYSDIGHSDSDPATIDSWVTFYTGSPSGFNPANPLGDGCFANLDNSGALSLTAGKPYLVMITSYSDANTGTYLFSLSGPGDVTDFNGANPMLRDGRINGQQAAPVILYCNGTSAHGLTVDGQVAFNVENGQSASGTWGSIAPLADGRMLLTSATPDGKPYYFVYAGCPHGHYDAMSGDPAVISDSGDY